MKKIKNVLLLVAVLLLAVMILTGCSSNKEVTSEKASEGDEALAEEIKVDGVVSNDKSFMVSTIDISRFEKDFDLNQYAEGDYIVNSFVNKTSKKEICVKIKLSKESSLLAAKDALLKEDEYAGAKVYENGDTEIVVNKANPDPAYRLNQVIFMKIDEAVYEIRYSLPVDANEEIGTIFLDNVIQNAKVYNK